MIPGDVGDRRHLGQQDVGRVEAAAETHLRDDELDVGLGEAEEGQRRGRFKECGTDLLRGRSEPARPAGQQLIGQRPAPQPDPLAEADQVR